MAGIDEAFERLTDDPEFADAVRLDPTGALAPFGLTLDDQARIEELIDPGGRAPRTFFDPPDTDL